MPVGFPFGGAGGYGVGISNGQLIAILGDSMTANNSVNTATNKGFANNGYFTWFNAIGKQCCNLPLTNNFGVTGNTLQQIASRVPNVIASGAKYCFVLGGTNNLTINDTFATMKNAMLTGILRPLLYAGVQPIVMPIPPRGSALTGQQQLVRVAFNSWLEELAQGRPDALAAANFPTGKNIVFSNANALLTDQTTGLPIANYFAEAGAAALHPNAAGAYILGNKLFQDVGYLFAPQFTQYNDPFDVYDATNNPGGNLLLTGATNLGLLTGTGGSLVTFTGVTPTGVLANGMRAFRGNGTSTATYVLSKDNPRSDIINGNGVRQVLTINATTSGANFENYDLRNNSQMGNVAPGDTVVAECTVQLAAASVNVKCANLQLLEVGAASNQTANACSDATFGVVSEGLGTGGFSITLRTPPITLQSGANGLNVDCNIVTDSTRGVTGAVAAASVGDIRVFKLQSY